MNENDAKKRIIILNEQLRYHANLYYTHDTPQISDENYDSLYQELVSLEQAFPHLRLNDSITKKVGSVILDGFEKAQHIFPQWSFDNIFSFNDLQKWEQKIKRLIEKKVPEYKEDIQYVVELKIDGLKVILDYENGKFVRGATRGDGMVGENITENLKQVSDIPKVISEKKKISVIGEAWIEKQQLEKINKERKKKDLSPYANPRNLAAGTLRQLDTSIIAKRNLKTFVYDIHSNDITQQYHDQELLYLKQNNFCVNHQYLVTNKISEIQKFYEQWTDKRHHQDYGVDGLVIKLNNTDICKKLGYTAKAPRFAIAYKFPAEQQTTMIKDIILQIGRTGVLTPVAELHPVTIDGSLVRRASLHNMDEIDRLDVRIGDTIIIEKAGDIIPKIKKVMKKMRSGNEQTFDLEAVLREMNISATEQISAAGVRSWYVGDTSDEMKIRQLSYFVSKKSMNIDGMGEKHIRALFNAGLVLVPSDIYTLTRDQILSLPLFKEKATDNLLTAIEQSQQVSLATLITSLGIRHVGREIAEIFADYFKNLDNLLHTSFEELISIHGIGQQIAYSIIEYINDNKKIQELEKLQKYITITETKDKKQHLSGLSFVITGSLKSFSRESVTKYLKEHGAKVSSQISLKTNYLIVGEKAGSKFKKADDLGVTILSEKDFIKQFAT